MRQLVSESVASSGEEVETQVDYRPECGTDFYRRAVWPCEPVAHAAPRASAEASLQNRGSVEIVGTDEEDVDTLHDDGDDVPESNEEVLKEEQKAIRPD